MILRLFHWPGSGSVKARPGNYAAARSLADGGFVVAALSPAWGSLCPP